MFRVWDSVSPGGIASSITRRHSIGSETLSFMVTLEPSKKDMRTYHAGWGFDTGLEYSKEREKFLPNDNLIDTSYEHQSIFFEVRVSVGLHNLTIGVSSSFPWKARMERKTVRGWEETFLMPEEAEVSYKNPIEISFLSLPTPPMSPRKLYLTKVPGLLAKELKGGYTAPESLTEEERSQPSARPAEEEETESETTETSRGPVRRKTTRSGF